MQLSTALLTLAASSFVQAATVSYDAKFDDIKLTGLGNVAANQSIGEYDGVDFKNFDLVGHNSEQNLGLTFESPPQAAVSQNSVAAALTGTETTFENIGLTTDFKGSNASSLSLDEFYFGCVVMTPTEVAAVDASCNLTVTAFTDGKKGSSATFNFKDPGVKGSMVQAKLPETGFKGVSNVSFTLLTHLLLPNGYLPLFLVDNVAYSIETS